MTAKPKAQIMREGRKSKKDAGLAMVSVQFWVKKRHQKKAKKLLDSAIDSLLHEIECNQKARNSSLQ